MWHLTGLYVPRYGVYMVTRATPFRFEDEVLEKADAIAWHETRRRAGNLTRAIPRAQAVRLAIEEAYEARRDAITADEVAWRSLLDRAGGSTAMLTLHGVGVGEPRPETVTETTDRGRRAVLRTPPRYDELRVTMQINGDPVDARLLTEDDGEHLTSVFLTDSAGLARVYLGTLSRFVDGDRPAYADRRLYSLADELGLPHR